MTRDSNDLDDLQEDQVDISSATDTQEPNGETGSLDVNKLQDEIEQLKEELAQTKEQVLRAHADVQNSHRRAQQDIEKAHKYGLEKFVNDILPVADNLERALATIKGHADSDNGMAEGVELTLKSMVDALERHKVEQINPEGEPFDPQLHQAMTAMEQADLEPNTVVTVFQKGYTLHGRLVRPAMVVVSKPPA